MTIEKALRLLRKHGDTRTDRREKILHYFNEEEKKDNTAREIYKFMEKHYPGISFDTVYRNLHLYEQLGILEVTELNAEKHFRITCSDQHHHHFICKLCGIAK